MNRKALHKLKPGVLALGLLFATAALHLCPDVAEAVKLEAVRLPQRAADPYVVQLSVGPRHEYDPTYYAPGPDACSVLAFRVLVLRYARHDNLVVEELEFAGDGCREQRVRTSHTINGVKMGYALGEGSQFAAGLQVVRWESWNRCTIEASHREYLLTLDRDGVINAEPLPQDRP